MSIFEKALTSAALVLCLTTGAGAFAQIDDQAVAEPATPPVVVDPSAPQASRIPSRESSSRDWRGELAADREAKGWGSDGPRSMDESRQNWIREYQRRDYYSGSGAQQRWDQYRNPQNRSDRIGANRSSFTPQRPDARSDAEMQAQRYAALYWMMKAQAEQERQSQDRR